MREISCPNCGERFDPRSAEFCPRRTCGYPVTFMAPADDQQADGAEEGVLRVPEEPTRDTDPLPPLPPPEPTPPAADASRTLLLPIRTEHPSAGSRAAGRELRWLDRRTAVVGLIVVLTAALSLVGIRLFSDSSADETLVSYQIVGDGLHFRVEPLGEVIMVLTSEHEVQETGSSRDVNGGLWRRVTITSGPGRGETGWVNDAFLAEID